MYNSFFGLSVSPFGNTPDPNFLFETASCSGALTRLTRAIVDRRGIAVLTGDAGTGKTTVLSRLLGSISVSQLQSSVILNPSMSAAELLEAILIDFGIDPVPESKARRLVLLQQLLIQGDRKGKVSALVVDEAHRLNPELLEEIRLLTNIEVDDRKLLQIILAGQTELDDLLGRWELRQFKQRISLHVRLDYLTSEETNDYIQFRWSRAGGKQPAPFSPVALKIIFAGSNGIPRVINNLCDNALLITFGEKRNTVAATDIRRVMTDMGMAWSEDAFALTAESVPRGVSARKDHGGRAATVAQTVL
jgi:general secretion pathway protein A